MFIMLVSVSTASTVLSVAAEQTAIVALIVIGASFWGLREIDRSRLRIRRRPVPVRVEQLETPLHREPDSTARLRAAGRLGGGAILLGALVACVTGIFLTLALQVVGGLLG